MAHRYYVKETDNRDDTDTDLILTDEDNEMEIVGKVSINPIELFKNMIENCATPDDVDPLLSKVDEIMERLRSNLPK